MKYLFLLMTLLTQIAFAQSDHDHHAKHNMVLFGGPDKIYVSHLVFKVPHNYQVNMELELPENVKQLYLQAKQGHENDLFLFVIDSMDIKNIQTTPEISGTLVHRTSKGEKIILDSHIHLKNQALHSQGPTFKVLYFDELPLSLARD